MTSHQVLVIITGFTHGRPVLDVSLTPLRGLKCQHVIQVMAVGVWFAYFGKISGPTLHLGAV